MQAQKLRRWNIAAFLLHSASFIAALIVVIKNAAGSFEATITVDFNDTIETVARYQVVWLELFFPAITALFHATIAFNKRVFRFYSQQVLRQRRNDLRWIEYSITASIMTWSIMQLSGASNIFVLLAVAVVLNVALQISGYLMERANPSKSKQQVDWAPMLLGWLVFAAQWVIIIAYFIVTASTGGAPGFVYGVVFAMFFMFSAFGAVLVFHYRGTWLKTPYQIEVAYVVLSFLSKFALDWIIIIGLVTR